jgi:5-methylcytosine-specific restriction endonuclease McrA
MPAAPKPKPRIVDKTFYSRVIERDGCCLYGLIHKDGCKGGLDPHHIVPRGRGGSDVLENGITLCRKHHDMAHRHEISIEELRRIRAMFDDEIVPVKR